MANSKICPVCRSEVLASARFCPECGKSFFVEEPAKRTNEKSSAYTQYGNASNDFQDTAPRQLKKDCPYCGAKVFASHSRCDVCDYDFLASQNSSLSRSGGGQGGQNHLQNQPSEFKNKQCKHCRYLDSGIHKQHEVKGFFSFKFYCGEMQKYVNENDPACSRFVDGNNYCYLTTACVEYRGLPDDCYELSTLRAFRDNYVKKLEGGEALVKKYYETAPAIVSKINESEQKDEIYVQIYDYITKCIEKIENKDFSTALELYTDMVEKFSKKFL